jgi:hypothetical protein
VPPGRNFAWKLTGKTEKREKTHGGRPTTLVALVRHPCHAALQPHHIEPSPHSYPGPPPRLPPPSEATAPASYMLADKKGPAQGHKTHTSGTGLRLQRRCPQGGERRKAAAIARSGKARARLSPGALKGKVERKIHSAAFKKGSGARSHRRRCGRPRSPERSLLELHHTRHHQCGKQAQPEACRLPPPKARPLHPTRSTRPAACLQRRSHSSATCCTGHREHHHRGAVAPPCHENLEPAAARSPQRSSAGGHMKDPEVT